MKRTLETPETHLQVFFDALGGGRGMADMEELYVLLQGVSAENLRRLEDRLSDGAVDLNFGNENERLTNYRSQSIHSNHDHDHDHDLV